MNELLTLLIAGVLAAAVGVGHAQQAAPPAEDKAAAAAKAEQEAAKKAKEAEALARAQDRVVANYRKNKEASSASGSTIHPAPQQGGTAAAEQQGGTATGQ